MQKENTNLLTSLSIYIVLSHVYKFFLFVQCVAWYPQAEPENLLAIGQANGRVLVTR